MPNNDNDLSHREAAFPSSEPYGVAALLLVESLIHGLCENSTLSSRQAVEIADRAVDVSFDQATAADGASAPLWRAHTLLSAIAASLRADDNGGRPRPGHAV